MTSLSARQWFRQFATLALAFSIVMASTATAQTSAITASPGGPKELHIVIIEGEDALNNIRQRTAREPIVKVEDENHKPIAGALILFAAHGGSSGASATFAGATTLSVHTDAAGQAVAAGFHPNALSGRYVIDVTATLGTLTATAVINEQNVTGTEPEPNPNPDAPVVVKAKRHIGKKVWITAGAVAIGVVLAVILTRGSSTTITAGAGGVGHP